MHRKPQLLLTILIASLWLGAFSLAKAHAEPVTLRTVSVLDRFEPFEAQLFYANHLWVGRSRRELDPFYRLEVYDRDGKLVVTKVLGHGLRYIEPFGPNAVLVVGTGVDGRSHFTVAAIDGAEVRLQMHTIPFGFLADRFLGTPEHLLFTDPGGFDDPQVPIGAPLQTLFDLGQGDGAPRWLPPHLGAPGQGLIEGTDLWVIAQRRHGLGTNLHRIALASGRDEIALDDDHQLDALEIIPNTKLLALSEADSGRVLTFDRETGKITRSFTVGSDRPHSLALVGHCLLAGAVETKQIFVFDLSQPSGTPVATWDLSAAGPAFYGLLAMSADANSGHVYARSAFPCPVNTTPKECPTHNEVVMVTPTPESIVTATCLKPASFSITPTK